MDKLLLSATVFDGSMNSKHHILWISLLPHLALPRNKSGLKVTVLHPRKKFNRLEQQISQPYQKTTSRNASSNVRTAGASALSAEGLYFKSA
jgi:hypothetical protein